MTENTDLYAGFEEKRQDQFVGACGELKALITHEVDRAVITVCCSSSRVDCENEVSELMRDMMAGTEGVSFLFSNYRLTVTVRPKERLDGALLRKIMDVISQTEKQLDLLPSCFECGRVTQTEWAETDNGIEALCGVCMDSMKLRKKHESIIGERERAAKREYTVGGIQKREVLSLVLSGVFSGTITCILGFFLCLMRVTLGLFLIPGLLSGFITSLLLNKSSYSKKFQKYAIGFVSTFVTILLLSFLNLELTEVVHKMITGGSVLYYNLPMLGEVWQYQLVCGIGGYFLAQVMYMFIIRE